MQIKISHESVIPLHEQLSNQLRQYILSGRWPPGHRIASETQLQRQLRVSRSTIRQALRSAEVEGLIERVPGRGTFVTHPIARSNNKHPIAFVVFDFDHPFQRELLHGAENAARIAGYRVIFCNSNSDVLQERCLLEQLQKDEVAGVLLWPSIGEGNPEYLAQLSRQGFPPVTMMDRTFRGVHWDYVASDNFAGAYTAVNHLVELGHEHIAFLSCQVLDLLPIADRLQGYRAALHDAGLSAQAPWLIGEPNREITASYALQTYSKADHPIISQIAAHLQRNPHTTAVFAMNDNVALLTLKAISSLGLRVPQDISLVGFDDMDIASYLPTPLTTVAQEAFAIGKRAAELLIERIEGWYSGAPRAEALPTHLRARASTTVAASHDSSSVRCLNERRNLS